jgi:hypothetical protein
MENFNVERLLLSRVAMRTSYLCNRRKDLFRLETSFSSSYCLFNCCQNYKLNSFLKIKKKNLHPFVEELELELSQLHMFCHNKIKGCKQKLPNSSISIDQYLCPNQFIICIHRSKKVILQDLLEHQRIKSSEIFNKCQKYNFRTENSTIYNNCRKQHYFNYLNNLNFHTIYIQYNYFIKSKICEEQFHFIPEEYGDEKNIKNFILHETSLNILFHLNFPENFFVDKFYLPKWIIQNKHFETQSYTPILINIKNDLNKNIKNLFLSSLRKNVLENKKISELLKNGVNQDNDYKVLTSSTFLQLIFLYKLFINNAELQRIKIKIKNTFKDEDINFLMNYKPLMIKGYNNLLFCGIW